jgi:hypothetical protein
VVVVVVVSPRVLIVCVDRLRVCLPRTRFVDHCADHISSCQVARGERVIYLLTSYRAVLACVRAVVGKHRGGGAQQKKDLCPVLQPQPTLIVTGLHPQLPSWKPVTACMICPDGRGVEGAASTIRTPPSDACITVH